MIYVNPLSINIEQKAIKKIALSDDLFFYDKNLKLMFVIFRICFLDFLFVYIISG